MGVEENKALVRGFFQAQQEGDIEHALACWAPDAANHGGAPEGTPLPPGLGRGLEGLRFVFESLRTAFPDRRFVIEDMIAEGDRVMCRLTVSGTHQGVPAAPVEGGRRLQRITPTGRSYRVQHIHILRIADGKIAEHWATRDDLRLLDQLGGLPDID